MENAKIRVNKENAFFTTSRGKNKVAYATKCKGCENDCKQSFRVKVVTCPDYRKKQKER